MFPIDHCHRAGTSISTLNTFPLPANRSKRTDFQPWLSFRRSCAFSILTFRLQSCGRHLASTFADFVSGLRPATAAAAVPPEPPTASSWTLPTLEKSTYSRRHLAGD